MIKSVKDLQGYQRIKFTKGRQGHGYLDVEEGIAVALMDEQGNDITESFQGEYELAEGNVFTIPEVMKPREAKKKADKLPKNP